MTKRVPDIRPSAGPYDDICYLFERMANLLGTSEGLGKRKQSRGAAKELSPERGEGPVSRDRPSQDK